MKHSELVLVIAAATTFYLKAKGTEIPDSEKAELEQIFAMVSRLDRLHMRRTANNSLSDYDIPDVQLQPEEVRLWERVQKEMVPLWETACATPLEKWRD
jgi:hypothetical protein